MNTPLKIVGLTVDTPSGELQSGAQFCGREVGREEREGSLMGGHICVNPL